MDPAWTRGPYEKQEITVGTPFQTLPVTLPNDNNHVHGARLASLPMEAKSYFETKDVSVVFSLVFGEGQVPLASWTTVPLYSAYPLFDIELWG